MKKLCLPKKKTQQQTQPDKLLQNPSQAHWQRAGRSFTCTPMGLNPRPFVILEGAKQASHHPWAYKDYV
jgi:hypothetical protein